MKATTSRVLLVAVAAGGLGLLASLWFNGNPFWRTQVGERALHAATNATAPAPPPGVTPAGIGDPMPAIALPGLDGAIVDLRTRYAGRRLLINVWASWCGPCIEEMPELDRFAATQGREGVQVIGLALDTPDAIEANAAQLVCLANLEALNAHFIAQGLAQAQRLPLLNQTAISQMQLLLADPTARRLERKS